MVDYHSSRPGHDLRYALSGEKMKKLGWGFRLSEVGLKKSSDGPLNPRWL